MLRIELVEGASGLKQQYQGVYVTLDRSPLCVKSGSS